MSSWYLSAGNDNTVMITSRVRLARNLSGIPFPSKMTDEMRMQVNEKIRRAVSQSEDLKVYNLKYIDMDSVPEIEVYAMVERHIISPEFASHTNGRAVIISEDESICIMVGEEDHLRIQVIYSGLEIEKAYETAERLDSALDKQLHFAFDERIGYLTECPTNLGTGLRASVMLHVPFMESAGDMARIGQSVGKIGLTVRGLYGEGSGSKAGLYQLSNQITLGISEKDALNNLKVIAHQIAEKECEMRANCNKVQMEDRVFRAFGILKNARILNSNEMMELASLIKTGIEMGILPLDSTVFTRMLIEGQPYMLMRKYSAMEAQERDIKRAEFVRDLLN